MPVRKRSLRSFYPGRWDPPALVLCSGALLLAGLTLPLIEIQQMIVLKSTYSVFSGVARLLGQGELLLGGIVLVFSVLFPAFKLTGLIAVWMARFADSQRTLVLHWISILGKWSMVDVFIVAIVIVTVKLKPLANVEPRAGVYVFAFAILFSMFTAGYINRLARQALQTSPREGSKD